MTEYLTSTEAQGQVTTNPPGCGGSTEFPLYDDRDSTSQSKAGATIRCAGVYAASFVLTTAIHSAFSIYVLGIFSQYLQQTIELLLAIVFGFVAGAIGGFVFLAAAIIRSWKAPEIAPRSRMIFISGVVAAIAVCSPPVIEILLVATPLDRWGAPIASNATELLSWGLLVTFSICFGAMAAKPSSQDLPTEAPPQ